MNLEPSGQQTGAYPIELTRWQRLPVCPWNQDFDPPPPGQWVTVCASQRALQYYCHDNHSQQRPNSARYCELRTRYLPVKASTEDCCLLKGLCQNSPLPTTLAFISRPDPPTHCQGSPWAIWLYLPRWQNPYFVWTPHWPGASTRQTCSGHILTKSDRLYIIYFA